LVSGQLSYVLLVGIVDAAILSWLALVWYRRAVRRLMRQRASDVTGTGAAPPERGAVQKSPDTASSPPTFAIFEPDGIRSARGWLPAIPGRRRLLIVYGVAAGLHALVITAFQLNQQSEVTWISALAR
jgi:hypothetical protein